jgi:transposase-like protein
VSETKRKIFSGEFKAKVALESIRGIKTVSKIAQDFGVHTTQVGLWKKELQGKASSLFDAKQGPKPVDSSSSPECLYSEIGCLKIELDLLKKIGDQPEVVRKNGSAPMNHWRLLFNTS